MGNNVTTRIQGRTSFKEPVSGPITGNDVSGQSNKAIVIWRGCKVGEAKTGPTGYYDDEAIAAPLKSWLSA